MTVYNVKPTWCPHLLLNSIFSYIFSNRNEIFIALTRSLGTTIQPNKCVTVCTVVQNCWTVVRVVQKSIGNGTFGGAATKKPLNRLKQNLAWVIMSGTPLSIPNGMSIGSGGWPPRRGEMLMVCAFFCLFISAAMGHTVEPILTSNVSKRVFLEILHSFGGQNNDITISWG